MRLAHRAIDDIAGRDLPAIVVGGSGLYVRAAVDGLDESIPVGDPEFRETLLAQAREQGNLAVHARLADIDPASAALIHPNNARRVIRALEIALYRAKRPRRCSRRTRQEPVVIPMRGFLGLQWNVGRFMLV